MKRQWLEIGVLSLVTLIATVWLGWWTVPLVGAGWGFSRQGEGFPALTAAVSASLAWVLLLGVTALRGPVGSLADMVGGATGVPGVVLVTAALVYPAILAGAAAALAGLVAKTQA